MRIFALARVAAFTAGVLSVHALADLPGVGTLALLALPALLPWRGRAAWAMAVLGVLVTVWRAQGLLDARWPLARHGEDVTVVGDIASLPEPEAEGWRFVFVPRDGAAPPMRVGWYRAPPDVRGGECWRLTLRVRTPHGSLNPGAFDYEGWLFRQGLGAAATVRDGERCADARAFALVRARQAIAQRVRAAVADATAAAFVTALTVGDDSRFRAADWDLFRATGTTHLVAISGFNVAIVAGVAFFACRALWALWPALCLRLPAPRAGLLGALLVAWLYALLAGFEPPVQRAVLMLAIALAALWAHRRARPSRVLALAWLAVLLWDPLAITSPGLWLSFGAVAAIFYVSLARLRRPGAWHALVLLQLLIAVALAPLTLHFFQGASWVAPLVNVLAVPFFAVLTPWALAGVALLLVAPALGAPVLAGASFALAAFHAALVRVAGLPELWVPASAGIAALLLAAAGVVLLFGPRGLPGRALGAACLLPLFVATPAAPRGGFEVAVLDVGQGLAVVVRTAHHTLVYDAGPAFPDGFDAGAAIVAPYLLARGVRDVDRLVVSHGDRDHSGGVAALRARLRVRDALGVPSAPCGAGQSWEWDGVRFEMLHPGGGARGDNDDSCVLRVRGPFTVLLPGDIEAAAEAELVARGADLRADLLVAPHHGSRTSSTPAFVAAVAPRVVVYGAGWRHHFRHPRPEVTARYAALGARQFATGAAGTVAVWREAGELRVEEYRRVGRRFWNAPADARPLARTD